VNRDGIRVLSVFPGRTATPPTQERLHALEGRPYRPESLLQPEDVAAVVVHALCLPRTAEVTEIKIRPHRQV
jgi:NADP-dependent 3-hydroxy acid dehydrogenase YdfG